MSEPSSHSEIDESPIERLFARLILSYGQQRFLSQFGAADISLVKAAWAKELRGMAGYQVAYALANLPVIPPNSVEFRDLCKRAPRFIASARIAYPAPKPEVVAAGREKLLKAQAEIKARASLGRRESQLEKLRELAEAGHRPTINQAAMVATILASKA